MKANRSAGGDITAVNAANAQARAADQAKNDKANLVSQGLDEDTLLLARRFGVRPLGINLGGPSVLSAGGGQTPGTGGGGGGNFLTKLLFGGLF